MTRSIRLFQITATLVAAACLLATGCSSDTESAAGTEDAATTGTDGTSGTDGTAGTSGTDGTDGTEPAVEFDSGLDDSKTLGELTSADAETACDAMATLYADVDYVSNAKQSGCKLVGLTEAQTALAMDENADGKAVCESKSNECLSSAAEPSVAARLQCEAVTAALVGGSCTLTVTDFEACVADSFSGRAEFASDVAALSCEMLLAQSPPESPSEPQSCARLQTECGPASR
jgi:hypothetical protein